MNSGDLGRRYASDVRALGEAKLRADKIEEDRRSEALLRASLPAKNLHDLLAPDVSAYNEAVGQFDKLSLRIADSKTDVLIDRAVGPTVELTFAEDGMTLRSIPAMRKGDIEVFAFSMSGNPFSPIYELIDPSGRTRRQQFDSEKIIEMIFRCLFLGVAS